MSLKDIQLGTVVRITNIKDGYNICTIIDRDCGMHGGEVRLARPYAYATRELGMLQPLVGAEVYKVSMERMIEANSPYEVFEGRDGNIRILAVGE
jgi:hypothetical protein